MVTIQENFNLKDHNTFGITVYARYFAVFSSVEELVYLLGKVGTDRYMILGGGSNILFLKDFNGWILLNKIKGREVKESGEEKVVIELGAGENWHDSVMWTLKQKWSGLENLSLIPGSAGAAPIQNIGAYGVELKDVFVNLEALNFVTGEAELFDLKACDFGYRDSYFKKEGKGKYAITKVRLLLSKKFDRINITYGALQKTLAANGKKYPDAKDVSDAVIAIRMSKLPDPEILGNAGSFFKNPVIPDELYKKLQVDYPAIPHYPVSPREVKVPAGWLIEQCGFKGIVYGATGSHKDQALVIVNYGKAGGKEIWEHARRVIRKVKEKFGIELAPEVNVIE